MPHTLSAQQQVHETGDIYRVATKLFRLRLDRDWSLAELAARARVPESVLRSIENAETDVDPGLKTLGALAKALGVRTGSLFEG